MKISLNEIIHAFDDLIREKKSREEIASWALKLLLSNDESDLIYEPSSEEKKIWDAIKYLTGVDLKNSPKSYFHSIDDFIEFRKKLEQ